MRRDTLHITLAFLGGVEESRLAGLVEGLGGVSGEPFTLRLDQLAHWRHNHIVWAGCAERPAALDALVGALRQRLAGLGFAVDDTPFVPHVTLLRKVPRAEPLPAMGAIVWPVSGWVLMESRLSEAGASYRRLAAGATGRGVGCGGFGLKPAHKGGRTRRLSHPSASAIRRPATGARWFAVRRRL